MEFNYKYSLQTIPKETKGITHIGQKLVKKILDILTGRNLYDRFIRECPFGYMLRNTNHTAAGSVLLWVLAREVEVSGRKDEMWFELGGRIYRFGKQEFLLITGLHFGGIDREIFQATQNDPNSLLQRWFNGVLPTISEFATFVEARSQLNREDEDVLNDEDLLKLANIGIAFHLFMGQDEKAKISLFLWIIIEDMERWNSFPWGTLCYSVLFHYLRMALTEERIRKPPRNINIYGYVYAFQV